MKPTALRLVMAAWLALALLPGAAYAQTVYQCTSATGVVTFSQAPCGANARAVATPKVAPPAPSGVGNTPPAVIESIDSAPGVPIASISEPSDAAVLERLDHECRQNLDGINRASNAQIALVEAEMAQRKPAAATGAEDVANARRGATQLTMTELGARLADLQTARDRALLAAQETCKTRHAAELIRQNDAAHQRRIDAAMEAQFGPAGPDPKTH